jgi:hypothetical protein
MVNIYSKFQGNISSSFKVIGKFVFWLTKKLSEQGNNWTIFVSQLWVLLVMMQILMVNIYSKLQCDISRSFKVMGKFVFLFTKNLSEKGNNWKIFVTELWVLLAMMQILMVNIYSKFQGDISSSFKVMGTVRISVHAKFKWKGGITLMNETKAVEE